MIIFYSYRYNVNCSSILSVDRTFSTGSKTINTQSVIITSQFQKMNLIGLLEFNTQYSVSILVYNLLGQMNNQTYLSNVSIKNQTCQNFEIIGYVNFILHCINTSSSQITLYYYDNSQLVTVNTGYTISNASQLQSVVIINNLLIILAIDQQVIYSQYFTSYNIILDSVKSDYNFLVGYQYEQFFMFGVKQLNDANYVYIYMYGSKTLNLSIPGINNSNQELFAIYNDGILQIFTPYFYYCYYFYIENQTMQLVSIFENLGVDVFIVQEAVGFLDVYNTESNYVFGIYYLNSYSMLRIILLDIQLYSNGSFNLNGYKSFPLKQIMSFQKNFQFQYVQQQSQPQIQLYILCTFGLHQFVGQ